METRTLQAAKHARSLTGVNRDADDYSRQRTWDTTRLTWSLPDWAAAVAIMANRVPSLSRKRMPAPKAAWVPGSGKIGSSRCYCWSGPW